MSRIVERMREAYATANVVRSEGPVRVIVDEPDPEFVPRPVGFTADIRRVEREPQLWGGDQA